MRGTSPFRLREDPDLGAVRRQAVIRRRQVLRLHRSSMNELRICPPPQRTSPLEVRLQNSEKYGPGRSGVISGNAVSRV